MENQKLQKILIVVSVLGIIGFVVVAVGGVTLYNTLNKKVTIVGEEQLKGSAVAPDIAPFKVEGFVGIPTSKNIAEDKNLKKIELRGHWTKTTTPGFEVVSPMETGKAVIAIDRYTAIVKVTRSTKKGEGPMQEEITYDALKIDNASDTYLATYGDAGLGTVVDTAGPARTLTIFSFPPLTN